MSKPNKVFTRSRKVLSLELEETYTSKFVAQDRLKELTTSNRYFRVTCHPFKIGARPNKYNGFKQSYHYVIRAYNKQSNSL